MVYETRNAFERLLVVDKTVAQGADLVGGLLTGKGGKHGDCRAKEVDGRDATANELVTNIATKALVDEGVEHGDGATLLLLLEELRYLVHAGGVGKASDVEGVNLKLRRRSHDYAVCGVATGVRDNEHDRLDVLYDLIGVQIETGHVFLLSLSHVATAAIARVVQLASRNANH